MHCSTGNSLRLATKGGVFSTHDVLVAEVGVVVLQPIRMHSFLSEGWRTETAVGVLHLECVETNERRGERSIFLTTLHIADLKVGNRVVVVLIVTFAEALKLVLSFRLAGSILGLGLCELALLTHLAKSALTALDLLSILARGVRRRGEPRNLSTKEIVDDHLGNTIKVRFSSTEKSATFTGEDTQKLDRVFGAALDTIGTLEMFRLDALQHGGDVLFWVVDVLNTNDTTEKDIFRSVILVRRDHTRAID
jgi:hypothetical protein